MFTGIVKEIGKIIEIKKSSDIIKLKVYSPIIFKDAEIDDSISINGVCLTIIEISKDIALFDILPETINKTNLSFLKANDLVNVESSLRFNGKVGGHIIQGHVDETVIITDIEKDGEAKKITFTGNPVYMDMLVEKAFISLDGISLTIISVTKETFQVMIIPHTFTNTVVKNWKIGSKVNMEVDITNKSIYKYMQLLKDKRA